MILSILATAGLSVVLYLTGVFIFLTPLPYLLTFYKKGWSAALASVLVSIVALVAFYRWPAQPLAISPLLGSVLYFCYFIWIACVVALGSRWLVSLKMEKGFASLMAAVLAPTLLVYFLLSFSLGFNLSQGIGEAFQAFLDNMTETQASRISPESLAYFQGQRPILVKWFVGTFLSLWVVFTMAVLSLNVMLVRRWLPEKPPFPRWEAFYLWRLSENWIWTPITIGGLYFLNTYVLKQETLGLTLANALVIVAAVYSFHGLAILSFFFRRRFSYWTRLAVYLAIFLFLHLVGPMILALGLFDFWFDFRKLKKVSTTP